MKKYTCINCDFYILIKENTDTVNVYICPHCAQLMKYEIEIEHISKEEIISIDKNNNRV